MNKAVSLSSGEKRSPLPVTPLGAGGMRPSTCPACGHHVSVPFLPAEWQPLATLGWPASAATARAMQRLPLEFVSCVGCGHVYNCRFDYRDVPYSNKPNLMYNRGWKWSQHLEWVCQQIVEHLPDDPTVVEIGCGEGHLLRALADRHPRGRFLGFDPNGAMHTEGRFEAHAELFDPGVHLPEYQPDLILSRHVLEHLVNPLGFLQSLDFAASWCQHPTQVFLEVPCIDRAIRTGRTVDFYYEHNSHFTTESFTRMLERCATSVEWVKHSYDGEVICGLALLGKSVEAVRHASEATQMYQGAMHGLVTIREQLAKLYESGKRVAIWGGTGKGAAFINHYGADGTRFPVVVDSDRDKVGTFVPGMGQEIRFRDYLLTWPAEVLLIPMQWRARDILHEMTQAGIHCGQILIEHGGRLVDFHRDEHPY
jgi:hypothetical protein